jgi:hypothetical protein
VVLRFLQLDVEQVGLDDGNALEPPARQGHGFDCVQLDQTVGIELLEIGVEEGLKFLGRFVGEDHGLGAHSVAECVARRFGPAFGGSGAVGFGTIARAASDLSLLGMALRG